MSLLAWGEGDLVKFHSAASRLSIAKWFLSPYCFSEILFGLLSACYDFFFNYAKGSGNLNYCGISLILLLPDRPSLAITKSGLYM